MLLQIAVVLATVRVVVFFCRKLGQPRVIGEMLAGIMLGPSLLGWLAPGVSAAVFPAESLSVLGALSEIGLVLFLFLVGLEHDTSALRGRGRVAIVVSHASIAVPFFLGSVLALLLYPLLSDDSVSFTNFALFMGTAMSITAFPVLARILVERGLLRTPVGSLALVCAAVDDVTGWIIVAGVLVVVRAGPARFPFWLMASGVALYVATMHFAVRRLVRLFQHAFAKRGEMTADLLGVLLLVVLASAWTTEWLGIHALFGAFMIGVVMPKDPKFVEAVTHRLTDVTMVLLPLFFALSGLRTRIGLLSGVTMWLYLAAVLVTAVLGKMAGAAVATRALGMPWRESMAIGVLVNTRGLMELIVLNIGLETGTISPALFAMMVLMAIVTTVMTAPLLGVIHRRRGLPFGDPSPIT